MGLSRRAIRGNYVAEVLPLTFPNRIPGESRLLMVLHAYFDESGTHDQAYAVSVGGYISTEDLWKRFEDEWRLAINCRGLEYFHARDFVNRRIDDDGNDYRDWGEDCVYDAYFRRLAGIIHNNTLGSISMSIPRKAYCDVFSEKGNSTTNDIYGLAVRAVCIDTRKVASEFAKEPWVSYVFESGGPHQSAINREMNALVNDAEYNEYCRLHGFGFHDKKSFGALQAADVLVYETFRYMSSEFGDDSRPQRRDELELLGRRERRWGHFDEDELRKWDAVAQAANDYHRGLL